MGIAALLAHIPFYFFSVGGSHEGASMALRGAALTAVVLWITETIPSHITALIPLIAFLLMGIAPGSTLSMVFARGSIVLYAVASMLGVAIQQTNLHRRFALGILASAGSNRQHPTAAWQLCAPARPPLACCPGALIANRQPPGGLLVKQGPRRARLRDAPLPHSHNVIKGY
jgi:hypothetical protein